MNAAVAAMHAYVPRCCDSDKGGFVSWANISSAVPTLGGTCWYCCAAIRVTGFCDLTQRCASALSLSRVDCVDESARGPEGGRVAEADMRLGALHDAADRIVCRSPSVAMAQHGLGSCDEVALGQ
jgi:hypothetical protein